jgi:hypothetical protein
VLSSPFSVESPFASACPFVSASFSGVYVSSLILLRFRGCCRKASESWRRRRRGLRTDAPGLLDAAASGENMMKLECARCARAGVVFAVVDLLMLAAFAWSTCRDQVGWKWIWRRKLLNSMPDGLLLFQTCEVTATMETRGKQRRGKHSLKAIIIFNSISTGLYAFIPPPAIPGTRYLQAKVHLVYSWISSLSNRTSSPGLNAGRPI